MIRAGKQDQHLRCLQFLWEIKTTLRTSAWSVSVCRKKKTVESTGVLIRLLRDPCQDRLETSWEAGYVNTLQLKEDGDVNTLQLKEDGDVNTLQLEEDAGQ